MFRLSISIILLISYFSSFSQSSIEFTEEEKQWIADHPSIVFGYEPNWPPFEIYKEGEYTGIIGDYVKIIERETGIKMVPGSPIPWSESLNKFKKGELKVLTSIGVTRNVKDEYSFTKPFISDPLVIVSRENYKVVNAFSDITTDVIVIPKGYNRTDSIKKYYPRAKLIFAKDVKSSLELVETGTADYFIGSYSVISYYINEYGFRGLTYVPTPNSMFLNLCLGTSKDWQIFRNIVQKVLDNVSEIEKFRIKAKWEVLRYESKNDTIPKNDVIKYIILGLSVFLIVLFLFYLWNKTLRRQIKTRVEAEEKLKRSLALINDKNAEKDILLKEIHHRVKNNLQIVYSMLNMQSREVENIEALKIISEGKSRVMAMALIHKILYESDNLDRVNLESYIKSLLNNISKIYDDSKKVSVSLETNQLQLDLDKAIPMGLILNELLTNSFKHAFVNKDSGEINIDLEESKGEVNFIYKDNGVGLGTNNLESFTTLGMKLVKRLANQLQTEANLESRDGVKVWFSFKK